MTPISSRVAPIGNVLFIGRGSEIFSPPGQKFAMINLKNCHNSMEQLLLKPSSASRLNEHRGGMTMAKYGKKAAQKVKRAMHERKRGTLKSGRSGKKVTSRKQAIAIGLSEARRAGAKVPRKKGR
jgi:Family of unknown function (DUF6496)